MFFLCILSSLVALDSYDADADAAVYKKLARRKKMHFKNHLCYICICMCMRKKDRFLPERRALVRGEGNYVSDGATINGAFIISNTQGALYI